jgi:hypothetical protein
MPPFVCGKFILIPPTLANCFYSSVASVSYHFFWLNYSFWRRTKMALKTNHAILIVRSPFFINRVFSAADRTANKIYLLSE